MTTTVTTARDQLHLLVRAGSPATITRGGTVAAFLVPAGALWALVNFAAPPIRREARSTRLCPTKRERRAMAMAEAFGLTDTGTSTLDIPVKRV